METKEQKPWYETADWGAEDCGSIYGHTAISGRMSDGSMHHSFAQVVTTLDGKSYQLGGDALSFIINAPKVATQRDSLLSVQKQLVEALEALLPIAEVGEYLTEAHSYSYGDGYSQPFEYGIDWQWQQSSPDLTHGPFALQADVDTWIKDQIETAKDDEVECVLESVKARAAILAAKASS